MTMGIVTPPPGPDIPAQVVLVATQPDFSELVKMLGARELKGVPMPMRLFQTDDAVIAGPFMGAPQAVMLLENLVAWGGTRFLFTGWCGSLAGSPGIGETFLATGSHVDEGTSFHYGETQQGRCVAASGELTDFLRQTLKGLSLPFAEGSAWTTDAIYRETPERIRHFAASGALAVEMEASAFFSAARYRGVDVAALMTVSDDVSGPLWKKGFGTKPFKKGRKRTLEAVAHMASQPAWLT